MEEWEEYNLNELILNSLEKKKFYTPTEIQKKVMVYANSKVDLIVQARTGEGKTLCYGIPIINYIYNFYERAPDKQKRISPVALILVPTRELGIQVKDHLSAMLRNYDVESTENLEKNSKIKEKFYFNIKIANVLGGFAKPKQIKILEKYNPEIIIATPGRLWEIISNDEANFLQKIYRLRFLVIDEADRMTEKNHFNELKLITDFVYTKLESVDIRKAEAQEYQENEENEENEEIEENEENEENENLEKIKSFQKKSKNFNKEKNEKKFLKKMNINNAHDEEEYFKQCREDKKLDNEENLQMAKELKKKRNLGNVEIETIDPMMLLDNIDSEMLLDDEDYEENSENEFGNRKNLALNEEDDSEEENKDSLTLDPRKMNRIKNKENEIKGIKEKKTMPRHLINMRTILCSATIETLHKNKKDKKGKKFEKNKSNKNILNDDDTDQTMNMDTLIKNLKFFNKCLYVKLNKFSGNDSEKDGEYYQKDNKTSNILPEKLVLDCYKTPSELKDYYLYHLLKEHGQQSMIVFTNSISHTKKLYSVFSLFDNFKLSVLHSKMQQSQRLKNLERFIKGQNNILFCTDIGARGLDIPSVDVIIHYHIPKMTENFIHRSGRTARALKDGKSISLISEGELGLYKNIMKDIKITEFAMKVLNLAHLERYKSLFEYAKNIEREDHKFKKEKREMQWYQKSSDQCDLILDDNDDMQNADSDDEKVQVSKMLSKKRKMDTMNKFKKKRVYQEIIGKNIKRTSFLTPEMVGKLNSFMGDEKLSDVNLTQTIFEANKDAQSFRFKEKQRKTRYKRRRKGK